MSSSDEFYLRRATGREVNILVDWAAEEGWNPGLEDAPCFRAEDPDGFIVGLIGNEPVTGISVVRYGADYGFLGFYLCRPAYRGQGFGYRTWQFGMNHLGDRTVGLDGVVDQQANYAKSGFVLAHRNIRYGGPAVVQGTEVQGAIVSVDTPELSASVMDYDRAFFPVPRDAFVKCWLTPEKRIARAWIREGAVAGYGVARICREGWKIGPLFADTVDGADALLDALNTEIGEATIYLDPPETNANAIALAERRGLSPVFETARMYKGDAPSLPMERTFGITTFELG